MKGPLPEIFPLQTERLLIRPPQLDDVAAISAAIDETYDQLQLWMEWARDRRGLHQATAEYVRRGLRSWQEMRQGRPPESLPLFLFQRADGHLLGASGFHDCLWEVPRLEIGYWLRASAQGQGYMTEAVRAISERALGEWRAKRLCICCDSSNTASQRVAEKAGYTLEGRLRLHRRRNDGVIVDTLVYARFA